MTDNELKEWFWNKFYSCYYVKHDDYPKNIFMYYDKDFIRKSKFRILQGKNILYPEKPSGVCLFEQDYENGWLRCDYNNIWVFFKSNTNYNYIEIRDLVKGWLEDDTKINILTPVDTLVLHTYLLDESKLKVLQI